MAKVNFDFQKREREKAKAEKKAAKVRDKAAAGRDQADAEAAANSNALDPTPSDSAA